MPYAHQGARSGAAGLQEQQLTGRPLNPFRRRPDESEEIGPHLGLARLLSCALPRDPIDRTVREAQLQALLRLVPLTISLQCLAAAVLSLELHRQVPASELSLWFAGVAGICVTRGVRAWRLRSQPGYAQRWPADVRSICLVIAALAALWLVPPLYW